MKRRRFIIVLGIASLLLTGYAARQFFFASMAGSALVGVPSEVAAQHHYSVLGVGVAFCYHHRHFWLHRMSRRFDTADFER
jgi:hypothetical protein